MRRWQRGLRMGSGMLRLRKRAERERIRQTAFLEAFAECGNISKACTAVGISRQCHYIWLAGDPDYPDRFKAARVQARDVLVDEVNRRAVEGVARPLYYRGELCGTVQEYSDTLLMFLVKGEWPEKFRDNAQVDHRFPDGVPSTQVTVVNINDPAAREARIDELIAKRGAGAGATPGMGYLGEKPEPVD